MTEACCAFKPRGLCKDLHPRYVLWMGQKLRCCPDLREFTRFRTQEPNYPGEALTFMLSDCYWQHTGGETLGSTAPGRACSQDLCELRVGFLLWPGFGGGVLGPLNKYRLSGQFYLLFEVCFPIDLNVLKINSS